MKKNKTDTKLLATLPLMSGYASRKDWEHACWQKIVKSRELLHMLTAPSERHNMVMRAAAMDAIRSGKSYRHISKKLWLSVQTISSIKKAMNGKSYRSYLERSKRERKKKHYSTRPAAAKSKREGRPQRTKYGTIYLP